jgi:hypothetical protein
VSNVVIVKVIDVMICNNESNTVANNLQPKLLMNFRNKSRWVDLREIGWGGMDWIDLAQDRDQWEGSCEQGNEPSGSIKCWEVLEWLHNWQLLRKG